MEPDRPLREITVAAYLERLAHTAPTPGGGSAAALVGALAAGLGEMVVGYTRGKPKFAKHETQVIAIGEQLQRAREMLSSAIDEDADAYAGLTAAFKVDKTDPTRKARIEAAAAIAAGVPYQTAVLARRVEHQLRELMAIGNPQLRSDVECALHFAAAAVHGAIANSRVNLPLIRPEDAARLARELDRVALR